eukprot:8011531-Pyramimonas_sp.AAC.1
MRGHDGLATGTAAAGPEQKLTDHMPGFERRHGNGRDRERQEHGVSGQPSLVQTKCATGTLCRES